VNDVIWRELRSVPHRPGTILGTLAGLLGTGGILFHTFSALLLRQRFMREEGGIHYAKNLRLNARPVPSEQNCLRVEIEFANCSRRFVISVEEKSHV
jgi:hypothetical protein